MPLIRFPSSGKLVSLLETHQTNLPRAALGIFLGVITGAALVTLYILLFEKGSRPTNVLSYFTVAALVWGADLILVAPLPWFVLHSNNMRSWRVAAGLGAVLTFVVTLGLTTDGFGLLNVFEMASPDTITTPSLTGAPSTIKGWSEAIQAALLCSAAGVVVALVIWQTAYRRSHLTR